MRRVIKIIDEAAVFLSMMAGVYFWVSFLVISLCSHLNNTQILQ